VKRAIAHLALIAIAAWLLAQMFRVTVAPQPLNLALWLALGAVAVDLLLLPLYSGADALIRRLPAPLINHVRFSAVLLLVWFPLILQRRPSGYVNALGREPPDYLGRWLALTAGLFVLSALVLAVRRLMASRAGAPRPSGR
jgi:hypothetical protein